MLLTRAALIAAISIVVANGVACAQGAIAPNGNANSGTNNGTMIVNPPPLPVVSYRVCSGEYERACQTHDAYLYCYADVRSWAADRCTSYTVQRVNTYGGNKCGYSIDAVICTGPK